MTAFECSKMPSLVSPVVQLATSKPLDGSVVSLSPCKVTHELGHLFYIAPLYWWWTSDHTMGPDTSTDSVVREGKARVSSSRDEKTKKAPRGKKVGHQRS